MNRTCRFRCVSVGVFAGAALLFASSAPSQQPVQEQGQPQVAPAAVASQKVALKKFVDATNQLSPEVRKHLSSGLQTYLRFANAVVNGTATKPSADVGHKTPWASGASFAGGAIAVSDPVLDPGSEGYTQNTTSSAWCGNSVVVGYQDTGALLRTDPKNVFGVPNSLDGISYSADAGKSFKDLGALTPGTFYANALMGDPIVTCSSPAHFQYASILNTLASDGMTPLIGPSVSFSTDGGKTWSEPLQVVSLDGSTEVADKPSLAVDPANARHMYLTYTHASALGCTNVEIVRSTNGGQKWSLPPVAINSDCNNPNVLMNTGSSVVVAPGGKIFVAYESFPVSTNGTSFGKTAIYFVRSLDGGATFGKPEKISDVTPAGDGVYLNGPLQANDYPQLAVDRTNRSSHGTVYITWPDGRNHVVPDRNAPSGTYAYADVFVAKSTNFGASFKVLGAISPTPKDFRGIGRDQFLPAIAVDSDGEVAVCYYDRRNDRANLRVDRFCSISANQGKTWKDQEVSVLNWLPTPNKDPLSGGATAVISEYDGLTSEFLLHGDGFFGAFIIEISGNQNVVATKF
jgi:hypothetical protein